MNEAQTRLDLIDPKLKAAGWGENGSRIRVEFPITKGRLIGHGKRGKHLEADYVLEYKNRRLAIIEAKADTKNYTDGVAQAKDYAERLHIRYTYSTNGRHIYAIDMAEGTEGDVSKFPSPDELWEMTYPTPKEEYKKEIANWRDRLLDVPFEDRGGTWQPRYYQNNAITKTLQAVAEKKDRILLTLATGTGKTAISFQIAWKLFQAKWTLQRDGARRPRILFLADRNILADQAFNAFNAFEEDALVRIAPDQIKKKGRVPKNGSIFFTIFQTFSAGGATEEDDEETTEQISELDIAAEPIITYSGKKGYFGDYPKDFFDFIIIDECHRGGASDESSWRDILEYFSPAVQLGLTATPKRDVNGDTYQYFGEPVYTYSLKDGINDGFLTPFRVQQIQTNYDEYTLTSDDTIIDGEAEPGDTFTYEHYGRRIIIKQVEEYRVKKFLSLINQSQKAIVFCSTQIHAAYIRDLINQNADSKNANYCHRVTAEDNALGEQHLRDFQDNEKAIPTILTTSKKLSTGVDAPEVRNIILLRPVKSMVEFKQIVGRGTRLFDGKDYFTIYDFVKAHEHFKDPAWDGDPEPPESTGGGGGNGGVCKKCQAKPCICNIEPELCEICQNDPCVCEKDEVRIVRVELSKGKALEIDSTIKTTFWDTEGKPISSEEFLKKLYGDLPTFFNSEEDLRKIWSLPGTRKKLLEEMSEKGYSSAQLEDLSRLVHGENSDLFDVLSFVAYHKDLVPRINRADKAKLHLNDYNPKQQEFINFVLDQYVQSGVTELDDEKLSPILTLKYHTIADAKASLGEIKTIRETFIGFQEHLYEKDAG